MASEYKLLSSKGQLLLVNIILIVLMSLFGVVIGLPLSFLPAGFVPFLSLILGIIALVILLWLGGIKKVWSGIHILDIPITFFVFQVTAIILVLMLQPVIPQIDKFLISFNAPISTIGDILTAFLWYSALYGLANMVKNKLVK